MKSFGNLVGKTTRATMHRDRQIKQVISRIVPARSLEHIQFCRLEGGRLRITVDSAAWVSRLRFTERQIIDLLRSENQDCHTVSYHVSPAEIPVVRRTSRAALKTPGSSRSIEGAARAVGTDDDDSLRQELLKLAKALRSDS